MNEPNADNVECVAAAIAGDQSALGQLFDKHRDRLYRMVAARIDARLAARVHESDVLQDVFVEAQRRITEYDPGGVPVFIWLRGLTNQRLIQLVRRHVGAEKRSTRKEIAVTGNQVDASTASLAKYFADRLTTVSRAVVREELREQIRGVLERLDELDREIISLRHFEQLTNEEAATVLGMNSSSASTRHLRALKKLRTYLEETPALADYVADFG